jgi:glycerol-3-phosphate acyltransferase PlsY
LSGWLGLATAGVWLLMAVVFRYSSLASLTAAVLAPVIYVLGDGGLWIKSNSIALSMTVMALFLLYRHSENINRLIKGTESKLGKKAGPPVPHAAHHGHGHHGHANAHPHKPDAKHDTSHDAKHAQPHGKHHP